MSSCVLHCDSLESPFCQLPRPLLYLVLRCLDRTSLLRCGLVSRFFYQLLTETPPSPLLWGDIKSHHANSNGSYFMCEGASRTDEDWMKLYRSFDQRRTQLSLDRHIQGLDSEAQHETNEQHMVSNFPAAGLDIITHPTHPQLLRLCLWDSETIHKKWKNMKILKAIPHLWIGEDTYCEEEEEEDDIHTSYLLANSLSYQSLLALATFRPRVLEITYRLWDEDLLVECFRALSVTLHELRLHPSNTLSTPTLLLKASQHVWNALPALRYLQRLHAPQLQITDPLTCLHTFNYKTKQHDKSDKTPYPIDYEVQQHHPFPKLHCLVIENMFKSISLLTLLATCPSLLTLSFKGWTDRNLAIFGLLLRITQKCSLSTITREDIRQMTQTSAVGHQTTNPSTSTSSSSSSSNMSTTSLPSHLNLLSAEDITLIYDILSCYPSSSPLRYFELVEEKSLTDVGFTHFLTNLYSSDIDHSYNFTPWIAFRLGYCPKISDQSLSLLLSFDHVLTSLLALHLALYASKTDIEQTGKPFAREIRGKIEEDDEEQRVDSVGIFNPNLISSQQSLTALSTSSLLQICKFQSLHKLHLQGFSIPLQPVFDIIFSPNKKQSNLSSTLFMLTLEHIVLNDVSLHYLSHFPFLRKLAIRNCPGVQAARLLPALTQLDGASTYSFPMLERLDWEIIDQEKEEIYTEEQCMKELQLVNIKVSKDRQTLRAKENKNIYTYVPMFVLAGEIVHLPGDH